MKADTFPLKLALHELRHGWRHFILLLICIVLGVGVMACIHTLGSSIERALSQEAQSLLGGDIEVTLPGKEATAEQLQLMQSFGKVSHVATLRAMVQHNGAPSLVELKAIDANYPLLGALELNEALSKADALAENGIIVDSTLLSQLDGKVGDIIQLGNSSYRIKATIKREPDRMVHIFSFGPRVIITHQALQPSGLITPTSLIKHHYRIVMESKTVNALKEVLSKRYPAAGWSFKTGTDGNATVKYFIDQLVGFLTLSGLATFLIGGIGIGSAVRAYLEKKSQTIAVMKVMGASRPLLLRSYVLTLGMLALVAGSIGVIIATAAIAGIFPLIGKWLPVILKQPWFDWRSSVLAVWYGLLITYLFSIPPLLNALQIRPSLLFRSHYGSLLRSGNNKKMWLVTARIGYILFITLFLTSKDRLFVVGAAVVALLAFALFFLCGVVIRLLAKRIQVQKLWLKLALGNIYRPGSAAGSVIFTIGISLTVLIALTLTEANFQQRITRIAEEKAPSLFMIDIQPFQQQAFETMLMQKAGSENVMLYPMVRGRISALNGKPIHESEVEEDVRWAIRGDRGLSYSALPPKNAVVSQGKWWDEHYRGKPQISVDERFLKGMHIALGDTITLNVLGQEITATITSARKINYMTFQINFAMMLSPGVIDDFPKTYVATLHQHLSMQEENALVRDIASEFPGVTIIRTHEAVEMVKNVMQHIATALRITVAISLLTGLIVLVSALSSSIEERLYDTAILKVLGARKRDILKSCTVEWLLLAFSTSLIAAILGTFSAWLIMQRFRGEGFSLMPEVTLVTLLFCIMVIWLTGYIGNRQIFKWNIMRMLTVGD